MIDIYRKYKTRDGREVRIYATDHDSTCGHMVSGAFFLDGGWWSASWTAEGFYGSSSYESPNDLIEVKSRIRRTVWLDVYPKGTCIAGEYDFTGRIARIKVEINCEEGEGLDG